MRLLLVQHGDAIAAEVDPDRPLSPRGAGDVERLADLLRGWNPRIDRVVHSGKSRARQSAEILAAALAPGVRPQAHPGLAPTAPVEPIAQQIRTSDEGWLLAGHMPFVGRLVDELVAGESTSHIVDFRPGTAVWLERGEHGDWGICWMVPPELLAAREDRSRQI